jgi:hypothetical protein
MRLKRVSVTHGARHAAFIADCGEYPKTVSPEFSALCGELIGQDTAEQIQARIAHEGTVNGYRENSTESYGRESERGDASAFTLHAVGAGVDCELSEVERVVCATSGHAGMSDNTSETAGETAGE